MSTTNSQIEVMPPVRDRSLESPESFFKVVEWVNSRGTSSASSPSSPLHVHHDDDEAYYVLKGELGARLNGTQVSIPAGSGIMVSRGTPHEFWNQYDGDTHFLLMTSPRMLDLVTEYDDLDEPSEAEIHELYERHNSEVLKFYPKGI